MRLHVREMSCALAAYSRCASFAERSQAVLASCQSRRVAEVRGALGLGGSPCAPGLEGCHAQRSVWVRRFTESGRPQHRSNEFHVNVQRWASALLFGH